MTEQTEYYHDQDLDRVLNDDVLVEKLQAWQENIPDFVNDLYQTIEAKLDGTSFPGPEHVNLMMHGFVAGWLHAEPSAESGSDRELSPYYIDGDGNFVLTMKPEAAMALLNILLEGGM